MAINVGVTGKGGTIVRLLVATLHVVSKPAVFSTRVGGCGFTREKIRLGTSYWFSWHRGMPKIYLVSMVTLGSCTHGLLALLHYAYSARK